MQAMTRNKSKRFQAIVAILLLFLAGISIVWAFHSDPSKVFGSLLINLGSGFLGAAITVIFVDWLVDKGRTDEASRKMGVRALNRIHHHVWVWQGGHRNLSIKELKAMLSMVIAEEKDETYKGPLRDPIPRFMQILFLRLGSDAADTFRHEPETIRAREHLREALKALEVLSGMHDGEAALTAKEVAERLYEAVDHLCKSLNIKESSEGVNVIKLRRDPSEPGQRWRHFGIRKQA